MAGIRETEAVMETPLVLKWSARYHLLEIDTFDSLEEAVRAAHFAAEEGTEAFEAIEVIHTDGRRELFEDREALPLWAELERDEYEAYRSRPKPVACVAITGPDGKHRAIHGIYRTEEAAETDAAGLRPMLGDRIEVLPLGTNGELPTGARTVLA